MTVPDLDSWLAGGPSLLTHTSAALQTFAAARAVALHMGKVLCVSQDRPGEPACPPLCECHAHQRCSAWMMLLPPAGFIINRVLMVMINEVSGLAAVHAYHELSTHGKLSAVSQAFFALMEGVASAQDIDNGMRLGTNQPMGPLELADFIG